jgi:hypothetical protein
MRHSHFPLGKSSLPKLEFRDYTRPLVAAVLHEVAKPLLSTFPMTERHEATLAALL